MKLSSVFGQIFLCSIPFGLILLSASNSVEAQNRRGTTRKNRQRTSVQMPKQNQVTTAIVVDERLAVLRDRPSLMAVPVQRMRRGHEIQILGNDEGDGVGFYRVQLSKNKFGYVQTQAVITTSRRGDDERLANLVRVSDGFEQIERATLFLNNYPKSVYRPAILLLLGDLLEESAQNLSREATRRFDADEIRATNAPVYSFYLNYNGLDRYGRLGIVFLFNQTAKQFHYDGARWKEIILKHSNSSEAGEAEKRLNALAEKMKP
ncbi:MAG: SH3 domain-containing protein [Pyrinomonadaceae bacterium]|nr:SH3 domain-containing protein [Pyrinomonadaceae bacterium]